MSFDFSSWPPTFPEAELDSFSSRHMPPPIRSSISLRPMVGNSTLPLQLSMLQSPSSQRLFRARASPTEHVQSSLRSDRNGCRASGSRHGCGRRCGRFRGSTIDGMEEIERRAALTTRTLPLQHRQPAARFETGRIQHHIVFLGSLSQRTASLHRYIFASTRYFLGIKAEDFAANDNPTRFVEGLVAAHAAYGAASAEILFVVQPGERNVFDQPLLEYEHRDHAILVILKPFTSLNRALPSTPPQRPHYLSEISAV